MNIAVRFFCCAAILSVLVVEVECNLDGSRLTCGVRKSASLSCHTCSGSSFTSQILAAQLHSQHFICTSSLQSSSWLIVFLSFCRYTKSYTDIERHKACAQELRNAFQHDDQKSGEGKGDPAAAVSKSGTLKPAFSRTRRQPSLLSSTRQDGG